MLELNSRSFGRSALRSWSGVLAALSVGFSGIGAQPEASYVVSHWDMKSGLPLNKVRAIVQTRDGYLWVGTFNGLARFDGVRFKVFDVGNTPALRNNAIESLCEDRFGRLWIGDNLGGITVLTNGHFEAVTLPLEWPAKPVLRLAAGQSDTVWAMNESGEVLPFVNGRAGKPLEWAASPVVLATDKAGQVWAAVAGRLCRLDAQRGAVPLSRGPGVITGWQAIFGAQSGGLWILDGDWLRRWDNGEWKEDRGRGNWGTILLSAFLESRSGDILGGSFKEGVRVLHRDGLAVNLTEQSGLSHNWAYCLCEDREGNIWVGTGNGGLNVLYPRRVTMVNAPDNWRSSAVLSVSPASEGGIWIGTEGAGVYRFQHGSFTNLSASESFWQSVVNSVLEDNAGRLWVGTWASFSGLRMFEAGQFKNAFSESESPGVVLTVFESSRGEIWLGTRSGPARLNRGRCEWVGNHDEQGRSAVRCFAETKDGDIWFGLDGGGVCRMRGNQLTRFTRADGLASDFVRTLHADVDGALWIGTRGGLSRFKAGASVPASLRSEAPAAVSPIPPFKSGHFANVTTQNGLPSDVICQILDDGGGYYWMSSFGGLFRVAKTELNRCADGQLETLSCLVCDSSGGLATLEMSEQGQPAGCRTSDGRLWFATGKGLAMVEPGQVRPNTLPPPVKIEELLVDGKPVELSDASEEVSPGLSLNAMPNGRRMVSIPPGATQYEFRYTGLSLANPGRVTFRYQLKGLHDDWFDGGSRRSAFYTKLNPGEYTFRVMARNADGLWNEQSAVLLFRVLPHFWQQWWFKAVSRLGGAAALGSAVLLFARRRARRKLEVLERQRAVERERARIARDIHDDLGSNLTRIVILSESARGPVSQPAQTAADLEEICLTARELTLQLSEIVWAVNPEHDTLESFASYIGKYAHDFLGKAGVRCRLDLPLKVPALVLDSPVRHNLLLAFKEALNNAVKHAGAKSVLVALHLHLSAAGPSPDNSLPGRAVSPKPPPTLSTLCPCFTLVVQDDGRGLTDPKASQGGHGLDNMRRRLADLGGVCEIETAPGTGTRVTLIVPIPRMSEPAG